MRELECGIINLIGRIVTLNNRIRKPDHIVLYFGNAEQKNHLRKLHREVCASCFVLSHSISNSHIDITHCQCNMQIEYERLVVNDTFDFVGIRLSLFVAIVWLSRGRTCAHAHACAYASLFCC